MTSNNAYIFLNGSYPYDSNFYKNLPIGEENLFCADGGAKKIIELNLIPKEVWGDFDSLNEEEIDWLKNRNVKLVSFEKDKDFTDGELLIKYVSSLNFNKIFIIGGIGGRLDHELTNINLAFKYKNIIFKEKYEELFVINEKHIFENLKGNTVSFIPFSDCVSGLTLHGFKYPLLDYTLFRGDSTCMSNVIEENSARVSFTCGKLLCSINY